MKEEKADVVVIGAGPGGLAAALQAKHTGADEVFLLDRNDELGGILTQCIHNGFGLHRFKRDLTGPEYAQRFIDEVNREAINVKLETIVLEVTPERKILATNSKEKIFKIRGKSIVLAMGCRERTREMLCIPGDRPAGILTAGLAQEWVNIRGYIPGREVVIVGSGDIGLIMARRFTLEGVNVKAVVEIMPYPGGLIRNVVQCLEDFDIPLLLEHIVTFVHGKDRVEGVSIAKVNSQKEPIAETEKLIPCDTLVLSVGLIPENELSLRAGVILDPATGGPFVDERMQTSIEGIFACGNVVQIQDLVDYVSFQGEIAGENAALYALGRFLSPKKMIELKKGRNINSLIPQFVSGQNRISLFIRVKKPEQKVKLVFGNNLKRKNIPMVRPNQMVLWEVSFEELELDGIKEFKINVIKR